MSGAKRFKAQQNEEVGLNVPIEVGSLCPVCLQSVRPPAAPPPPLASPATDTRVAVARRP